MLNLTPQQTADYLHRSYTAVDGLWFMKAEAVLGFEGALDIDAEVWKVMPKIQARKLKEICGMKAGMDALFECFTAKLTLDGFAFAAQRDDTAGITITISGCPWVELLKKAGRGGLAERIGRRICDTEYAVWAQEFGPGISVEFGDRLCRGCRECVLKFTASARPSR
jgi:hypothetical protein